MLAVYHRLGRLCIQFEHSPSRGWFLQSQAYCSQQESVQDVIASIIRTAKASDPKLSESASKNSTPSKVGESRKKAAHNVISGEKESESPKPVQKAALSSDIASEAEIETAEPVLNERRRTPVTYQTELKKKVLQELESQTDEESETIAFIKSVRFSQPLVPEQEDYKERFASFVEKMNLRNLPAVTRIISATQTDYQKFILQQWKLRMVEELGIQGFEEYQKETFAKGHKLHSSIQQKLSNEPVEVTPNIEGYWKSLQVALPAIEHVYSLEDEISHPHLHYRGIFDCLAIYRGCPCVIDWKASSKPKPSLRDTYDYPLQLVAYAGALNQSDYLSQRGIPQVNNAALVVAYENGDPAHIHFLDAAKCQYYWKKWLDKLLQYWVAKSKGNAA